MAYPDWYRPSKSHARKVRLRVLQGRHPFGMPLGPEHSTCGSCAHLVRKKLAKTYLKCEFNQTRSAASDVRAGWRGCSLWKPAP